MSINWVMLQNDPTEGFVRLPNEKTLWKSSPRTGLSLTYDPSPIQSHDGTIYMTNQRIVYLPAKATDVFKSFSCPVLNLHDSHVVVPWFGPNSWSALVQPVPGGGLVPKRNGDRPISIEIKLTFREGGAPEFQTQLERLKERMLSVIEQVCELNGSLRNRQDAINRVDLRSVHLEELPTYQASGQDRIASFTPDRQEAHPGTAIAGLPNARTRTTQPQQSQGVANAGNVTLQESEDRHPSDAPPGYEETQQQSVQAEMDRRLSPGI